MAFDNKFITKESLKIYLNLSWFKLYTISQKKRQFILADTYSPWKDTFKPPSWKAIWDWVRVWKHLPWIFHLVDLFLSLVPIIIQFPFLLSCLSCDFDQNNGKNQGIDIFSTENPPWYIIIAVSLSWLVLVIGSIIIVWIQFFFHLLAFLCDFRQKMAKNKGLQFSAQGNHHGRLLLNISEAANSEEVAVGTDPNND